MCVNMDGKRGRKMYYVLIRAWFVVSGRVQGQIREDKQGGLPLECRISLHSFRYI